VEHEQYHRRELEELKAVTTVEHMAKNKFVTHFRSKKYNLVLCSYSFELLLAYVQEQKFMTILSIINQHLDIKGAVRACTHLARRFWGVCGRLCTDDHCLELYAPHACSTDRVIVPRVQFSAGSRSKSTRCLGWAGQCQPNVSITVLTNNAFLACHLHTPHMACSGGT
jgi:hypothetical protein